MRSAIEAIVSARHVVVMTGAGISAESGVPTFRDAQTGLWAKYDPLELATPEAFRRDPTLVWDWYKWRLERVRQAQPNPGHLALAQLARVVSRFTLITQNVDGLHQRAGSDPVIELHGNITRTKCFDHHHPFNGWPDDVEVRPPVCETCGGLMRPDVVWFHESLPEDALRAAERASLDADVFLSVGTSSVVHPAAALAFAAAENGAQVVEINLAETPLTSQVDHFLRGPAGEVLPRLVAALE